MYSNSNKRKHSSCFFNHDNHDGLTQIDEEPNLETRQLILAAEHGDLNIVTSLINKRNEFNHAAYLAAIENGHSPIIQFFMTTFPSMNLIQKFNSEDNYNTWVEEFPSLVDVIKQGHVGLLTLLLGNGANCNFVCQKNNVTPLMAASQLGNQDMIELLLDHQANINFTTWALKESALTAAAQGGHLEIIELLMTRGATLTTTQNADENGHQMFPLPNQTIVNSEHPAIVAARYGRLSVVDWFLTHPNPQLRVGINTIFNDRRIYRDDYDGLNINCTLLMEAARNGHINLVEHLLIAHGAEINTHNSSGDTALSETCKTDFINMVETLLRYGAHTNLSPLFNRQEMRLLVNLKCVKLLLEHGANPQCDKALGHITYHRRDDFAALFLEYGAEFKNLGLNNPDNFRYPDFYRLFQHRYYAVAEETTLSVSHAPMR